MGKSKKTEISLEDLITKIERILDVEIDSLPDTLYSLPPEKKVDFIKNLLPVVVKYRETHHPGDPWEIL